MLEKLDGEEMAVEGPGHVSQVLSAHCAYKGLGALGRLPGAFFLFSPPPYSHPRGTMHVEAGQTASPSVAELARNHSPGGVVGRYEQHN